MKPRAAWPSFVRSSNSKTNWWYVKSVDFGVTEANKVFIRFRWKVVIHNGIDRAQAFDLAAPFIDDRDFVVDTDREVCTISWPPGCNHT